MKINLLSICIFFLLVIPSSLFSQRGETGDKVFSNRFPPDVLNYFSEASLEIKNTVEHDIIVLIRDQYRKYVRHVYIRNGERFTLKNLPITRIYVQFKSLEFYFEDKKVSVINFGEKNIFTFFYDASMEGNYFEISEEEFFTP